MKTCIGKIMDFVLYAKRKISGNRLPQDLHLPNSSSDVHLYQAEGLNLR